MKIRKYYRFTSRVLALLLSLCMVLSLLSSLSPLIGKIEAKNGTNSGNGATEKAIKRIADNDTSDGYQTALLSEENGTRYAGRIWSDKSVFAYGETDDNNHRVKDTVTLDMESDGYQSEVKFNSDFLHEYSAIASSQVVNEYPPSPIDLTLVLDISSSMDQETPIGGTTQTTGTDYTTPTEQTWKDLRESLINPFIEDIKAGEFNGYKYEYEESDGAKISGDYSDLQSSDVDNETIKKAAEAAAEKAFEHTRFLNLLTSANRVIKQLMTNNEENRVSVVVYDRRATVIMPLAHYQPNTEPMSTMAKNDGLLDTGHLGTDCDNADSASDIIYEKLKPLVFDYIVPFFDSHGREGEGSKNPTNYVSCSAFEVKATPKDENVQVFDHRFNWEYRIAGTNTQAGITAGLNELASAKDTTLTKKISDGSLKTVPRIPAAIIMTDGGSNTVANGQWYNPEFNIPVQRSDIQNDWSPIVVTQTILTASYLKSAVEKNYSEYSKLNGGQKIPIYTVGVDLRDDTDNWVPERLYPMMDPEKYLKEKAEIPSKVPNPSTDSGDLDLNETTKDHIDKANTLVNTWLSNPDQEQTSKFPVTSQRSSGGFAATFQQTESDYNGNYSYNQYLIPFESESNNLNGNSQFEDTGNPGYGTYNLGWHGWIQKPDNLKNAIGNFTSVIEGTATFESYNSAVSKQEDVNNLAKYTKADREITKTSQSGEGEEGKSRKVEAVTQDDMKENRDYVTQFYNVTSGQLEGIFSEILTEVLGKVFVPVSGENEAGVSDSITYQDPLGDYMEVKNQSLTVTPNHTGVVEDEDKVDSNPTTYDLAMLHFGEMHGLVRTGIYDFNWNDQYMKATSGGAGYNPIKMGWYKGEPNEAQYAEDLTAVNEAEQASGGLKGKNEDEKTVDAWRKGWVYRLNYSTLASYVPLVETPKDPNDLSTQAKNTVYTVYRFACSPKDRNELRINPIYGDTVPQGAKEAYQQAINNNKGQYPVGNESYKDYDGVYRLSDIRVWVEDYGDYVDSDGSITPDSSLYNSSLYLNIPAGAIPTQLAEITMGENGIAAYETNLGSDYLKNNNKNSKDELNDEQKEQYHKLQYQSTPIRLFYSVGLEEDLITKDGNVDVSQISDEYKNEHTTDDAHIWFDSNYYSETDYGDYTTEKSNVSRGDPTITFSPNELNRYYLNQSNVPIYAHAYQVENEDGDLFPVDNPKGQWDDNDKPNGGNGDTEWDKSAWKGGYYLGSYDSIAKFKKAYLDAKRSPDKLIEDSDGIKYPLKEENKERVVFLKTDLLEHVTTNPNGVYTKDSTAINSTDYYFRAISYYHQDETRGTGINPSTNKEIENSCTGYAEQRVMTKLGSEFGSGFSSEEIGNGDMLCWALLDNTNTDITSKYNSNTAIGDRTRGEPTFEKLFYSSESKEESPSNLETYLTGIGVGSKNKDDLSNEITYWTDIVRSNEAIQNKINLFKTYLDEGSKSESNKPLITPADLDTLSGKDFDPTTESNSQLLEKAKMEYEKYFNWIVAMSTGAIRVGDMAQFQEAKEENKTATAENRYVPVVAGDSGVGDLAKFNGYYGNNGRLEIPNSSLVITKTLESPLGAELNSIQENKQFNYNVHIDDLNGDYKATIVNYNNYSKTWQKELGSISVLTSNNGLLRNTDGGLALFELGNKEDRGDIGNPNPGGDEYHARHIVQVGSSFYYANEDGSPSYNEPCEKELSDLYYLYLPENAIDENSNVRTIYTSDPNIYPDIYTREGGSTGRTTYFPKGEEKETEVKRGIRDVLREEKDGKTAGTETYWILDARLIPTETVDNYTPEESSIAIEATDGEDQGWTYKEEDDVKYKHLLNIDLAFYYPPSTIGTGTISSPFKIRSLFNTTTLQFNNGDASIKLQNRQGLLFNGLDSQQYQVTEDLTDNVKEGYSFDHLRQFKSDGSTTNKDLKDYKEAPANQYLIEGKLNNGQDQVHYYNTFEVGSLTLNKNIVPYDAVGDSGKEFEFEITLDEYQGQLITGTFNLSNNDTITFTKSDETHSKATLKLKHNETKTIEGLPAGVKYTITEKPPQGESYQVSSSGSTGEIKPNTENTVLFTNIKSGIDKGILTVTKTVTGNAGDTEKSFNFILKVYKTDDTSENNIDTSFEGSYGDFTFNKGICNFSLKDNEARTGFNLPQGKTYTITEVEANQDGYTTEVTRTVGKIGGDEDADSRSPGENGIISGSITENTVDYVVFNNNKSVGNVRVEKLVSGNAADVNQEFDFSITLKGDGAETISGSGYVKDNETIRFTPNSETNSSTATFKLKHGQNILFENLPVGLEYEITETDLETGYTVTKTGETGEIEEGITKEATFTNTKNSKSDKKEITPGADQTVDVGKEITYAIDWVNTESQEAKVVITDKLDPGVDFISASFDELELRANTEDNKVEKDKQSITYFPESEPSNKHTVVWDLGTQGQGKSGTVYLTVRVNTNAQYNWDYSPDDYPGNNTLDSSTNDFLVRNKAKVEVGNNSVLTTEIDNKVTGNPDEVTVKLEAKKSVIDNNNHPVEDDLTKYQFSLEKIQYEPDKSLNPESADNTTEISEESDQTNKNNLEISDSETTQNNPDETKEDNRTGSSEEKKDESVEAGEENSNNQEGLSNDYEFSSDQENVSVEEDDSNKETNPDKSEVVESENEEEVDLTQELIENSPGNKVLSHSCSFKLLYNLGNLDLGEFLVKENNSVLEETERKAKEDISDLDNQEEKTENTENQEQPDSKEESFESEEEITDPSPEIDETIPELESSQECKEEFSIIPNLEKLVFNLSDLLGNSQEEVNKIAQDDQIEPIEVVRANKDGIVRFGDLTFTEKDLGEHTYYIKEVVTESERDPSVTYDSTVWEVKVKVSKVDNKLVANVTYKNLTNSKTSEEVQFVNKKETSTTGDLTVSKTVQGSEGDSDKEFHFTVTLDDTSISGEYGDITFTEGVATFSLKHNESKTAKGLPVGVVYTITETEANQDGYTTTTSGETGKIIAGSLAKAQFINSKGTTDLGNLTVTKTVTGSKAEYSRHFHFEVHLSDKSINGTYGSMNFTNGVAKFTLRDNQAETAVGLPKGVDYSIIETDANKDGYLTSSTGETGTIGNNQVEFSTFTNNRNPDKTELVVKKKVIGSAGETTREFNFQVKLTDTSISGTYGGMTFDKGVATFKLKDGQSVSATGLPVGTEYTVTETDANKDGYVSSSTGANGKLEEDKTATAEFTNTKDSDENPHKVETIPGNGKTVVKDEEITYEITWKNYLDEEATVVVTDPLDPGLDYVSASYKEGSPQGETPTYNNSTRTVTWNLGKQKAHSEGVVVLKVKVNDDAWYLWDYNENTSLDKNHTDNMVYNRATVTVNNESKQTEIPENPVEEKPKKEEVTPGNKTEVAVGQFITYKISWANNDQEVADVTVTDHLDPGLTFDSADYEIGTPVGEEAVYDENSHTVTWKIPNQEPGTRGQVVLTVIVNEKAKKEWSYEKPQLGEGDDHIVYNEAGVTVGNHPEVKTERQENPTDEEKPHKTEEDPGDKQQVAVGDEITYRIIWNNNQPGQNTIKVRDPLDSGVDFVSANFGTAGENRGIQKGESYDQDGFKLSYDESSRTVSWEIPNRDEGTTGYVVLKVKVNTSAVKQVEDTAYVHVGNQSEQQTETVVNPLESPRIEIEKYHKKVDRPWTVSDHVNEIDEPISYRLIVRSTGRVQAKNVRLSDLLPETITPEQGSFTLTKYVGGQKVASQIVPEWKDLGSKDTLLWRLGDMNQGDWYDISFSFKQPEDEADTWWINHATVTYDNIKDDQDIVAADIQGLDNQVEMLSLGSTQNNLGHDEKAFEGIEGKKNYHSDLPDGTEIVKYSADVRETILDNEKGPDKEELSPGDGEQVGVGELITYQISYQNHQDKAGTVTIVDPLDVGVDFVEASDNGSYDASAKLPDNLSVDYSYHGVVMWNIENVEPGGEGVVTLTVRTNPAALGAGEVKDQAFVKDPSNEWKDTSEPVNPTDENHKEEVTPGSGIGVAVGDLVTYDITYTNNTDHTTDVTILDPVDIGLDYVESSNGGSYIEGAVLPDEAPVPDYQYHGILTWIIPQVGAGESGVVSATFKVNSNIAISGQIKDQADIKVDNNWTQTEEPENPYNEKQHKLEKTPGDGYGVHVGDEITYEIEYFNNTDSTADVTIVDPLDSGVDFKNASSPGKYYKTELLPAGSVDYDYQGIVKWVIEDVAPQTGGTVSLTVMVNNNAEAKDIVKNQAFVQIGNGPWNATEEPVNPLGEPNIDILKEQATFKPDGTPDVSRTTEYIEFTPGDRVTYYITVTNIGDVAAHNITLTDPLPPGLTLIPETATEGVYIENGQLTWYFDELGVGESRTIEVSFTCQLPQIVTEKIYFRNIAYVDWDENPNSGPKPSNEVVIGDPPNTPSDSSNSNSSGSPSTKITRTTTTTTTTKNPSSSTSTSSPKTGIENAVIPILLGLILLGIVVLACMVVKQLKEQRE